jgi:UDP-2,4-diacetamido-2,4,6-trideoxy-beta-L-altropyranose hydrolase
VNPGTLVIRADASVAMGTGHVMRCLALAQEWHDSGGEVIFAAAELTPAIARRLQNEGMEIANLRSCCGSADDAHEVAALAHKRHATWIVVDGYQFNSAYQRSIKDAGLRLLSVDDTGQCGPYSADLVLDQNAYANEKMYSNSDPATKVLLGPHYALLRREFTSWRKWDRNLAPIARRVLITMGGSDPENFTARVIAAVQAVAMQSVEITVVIGGSNTHRDSLRELESQCPNKIRWQIDVKNMAELMAWADLAVSAAGTTCYELALLQVPMVLIALAENQVPTAGALANAGAAIDAGWFHDFDQQRFGSLVGRLILDCKLRRSLAKNARRLVDGMGANRVCQALLSDQAARTRALPNLQVGVC